jgi:hypothetical protein
MDGIGEDEMVATGRTKGIGKEELPGEKRGEDWVGFGWS